MASLASTDDLEMRLGSALADEDRAQAVLDDVSAIVRAYTGQQFTLVEDDEVRLRVRGATVRLPQRPVVDVTSVTSTTGSTIVHVWDAGEVVTLAGYGHPLYTFEVEPFTTRDPWVDVVYSHGYESVPADIVAVVAQMSARSYGRSPADSGVSQESIAGYSYSVGSAAAAGPAGMLAHERAILDLYRRPIGTIRVGQ